MDRILQLLDSIKKNKKKTKKKKKKKENWLLVWIDLKYLGIKKPNYVTINWTWSRTKHNLLFSKNFLFGWPESDQKNNWTAKIYQLPKNLASKNQIRLRGSKNTWNSEKNREKNRMWIKMVETKI